jgi:nucleoid-associated protein YgaU
MKFDLATLNPNLVRMTGIGAAFFTVTLALILLQPSAPKPAPQPDMSASLPDSNDENTVARGDTSLLGLTEAEPTDPLSATVLASLASNAPQPAAASDDPLRSLTSGVLASLSGNGSVSDAPRSMEQLVVQALRQGQSDAYIDALLNEAASTGRIDVPEALRTNQGRVDTNTLLADLVSKSSPATTGHVTDTNAKGVEVRVVQRAGETRKYNFYTVQPGDSLGAIAHRFYGDALFYRSIYDANRQVLSSPDRVRAGQRLSIPEITSG